MERRGKQIFILFLFLIIFSLFIGGISFALFYEKASCIDGKKNQDETGIDCGGKCSEYCLADLASRPIEVSEVEVLPYTSTTSDIIGTVSNKNSKAALKNGTFTYTLYNQANNIISEESGTFSLLPLESRILPVLGIQVSASQIARSELKVSQEEWIALTDFTESPDIRVINQQFSLLSSQAGFAEAKGLVQNKSPFDIRTLSVVVVPRDQSGKALSVNKTTINTLQSGEERDFRLIWPQAFLGTPSRTEMQVQFDMLAEDAFVKQYFRGEDVPTSFPVQ